MQKTLGGERLGSGNKMKVELHGYERSTHDLSYLWRSTMASGTLVPFLSEVALPGDTFDINLGAECLTHPTIGPLFGSYKLQIDVFQAPIRLYNSKLHNNALGIGLKMADIKIPTITLPALKTTTLPGDIDNSQINPSCILSYLGIRGVGTNRSVSDVTRAFNAIPILVYWDTYKNYYANKQQEQGEVLHTPAPPLNMTVDNINVQSPTEPSVTLPADPATGTILIRNSTLIEINYTGTPPIPEQIIVNSQQLGAVPLNELVWEGVLTDTGTSLTGHITKGTITLTNWRYANANELPSTPPEITQFSLDQIDQMREAILAFNTPATPFDINIDTANALAPYNYLSQVSNGIPNIMASQEGLGLKTYQSDLFNNWLNKEWIDGVDGISSITAVDTTGGSFTIDTLNLSRKVYNLLNRVLVSGGSYDDWLDAVYDHPRYLRCETPMYMGGLIKELVFQQVISNSASETSDGIQQLGTLAGRGVMSQKHKGGQVTIKVDEPSYIMGIVSLTPRLDYSQGNKWDINLETLDDLHKPALDEIGFQELICEQMAWWSTSYDGTIPGWVQRSAGKQPAWINYMTNVNQCRGNFAVGNGDAVGEMFMTLNRRYTPDDNGDFVDIADMTTYIDPSKYNQIFAQTSLDSQNFWMQIAIDMTVRRKMSAKVMPNL